MGAPETIRQREERYLMNTYARSDVLFVRGEGALLFDDAGGEYLDFLSGIAVTSLGHCHPELVEAGAAQMARLDHVSNLFLTEPMVDLAERLSRGSIGGPVFFANSGSEANECAIKLARKHASGRGVVDPEIVVLEGGWHGRTYGAMSATHSLTGGSEFGPLLPGFVAVPFDDTAALASSVGPRTAAVMIETIQGEAGVRPLSPEFLGLARELTSPDGALLVIDEVQTGIGRTGSLWSFEQAGVQPDVLTAAKALGGGAAIGACIASEGLGQVLGPGDHGSTFAAGPVASAIALKVLELVDDPATLRRVRTLGDMLAGNLGDLPGVENVRGRGLMLGVGLADGFDAGRLRDDLLLRGLVVNAPRPDTIRLLPPFVLTDEQVEKAIGIFAEGLGSIRSG